MADAAAVSPLAASDRAKILLYSGAIIVALHFVNLAAGVQVIPLSFVLKNKLHLSASDLAMFSVWAGIPGYLSFAFGMVRDFWNPFGLGDRGYFLLFGSLAAAMLAILAFAPVSEAMLLASTLAFSVCFLAMWSALNGLAAIIGQRHAMSGQISALWNFAGTLAIVSALFLGGLLSDRLETMSTSGAVRTLYLLLAGVMVCIAALGLLKPKALSTDLVRGAGPGILADLARLARHWPIYPALVTWMLWNFSPGTQTVLQYYLSNTLHASDAQWGEYNAIFYATSVPAFVLFGFLSSRFSLSALLWSGAALGVTQMLPLLFVHSATGALVAAAPIGLIGGLATAAFMDLLIRSCPKGLEGTMMMMAWSLFAVSVNGGNLWGTSLYERGGFVLCVIATTIVYALILPVLLTVPKRLIATADGSLTTDDAHD